MSGFGAAVGAPPLRAALRRSELRRVVLAFGLSVTAEWALWIGLLVYAYDRGGSTTAGLVSGSRGLRLGLKKWVVTC